MTVRAFIGIGSNLGDRVAHCAEAVAALGRLPTTRLVRVSPWIETPPHEGVAGGRFLNGVAEIATELSPRALLQSLQAIEVALGRPAMHCHGMARAMDLDILLYGERLVREVDLVIPHPRMAGRRFVLEPLTAIAPDVRHPVLQLTVAEQLRRLDTATDGTPAEIAP
jgi:2-amino-4-hydroxy-6-hydroxymethyldihydropteridine diphosphokinase